MEYKTLIVKIEDGIAFVTINRPDAMNALNQMVLRDLTEAFCMLSDNANVRVVILTGAGEKAFVAGADIRTMAEFNQEQAHAFSQNGQTVFHDILTFPKPVIAAINGFAFGGGCELAMFCHIRIASGNAKFGQPEPGLGLIPGFGGTQILPRLVGQGVAFKLLLTGQTINAEEAYRIGLVNQIVPTVMTPAQHVEDISKPNLFTTKDNLLHAAQEMANVMMKMSPGALTHIIEAVTNGAGIPLNDALDVESEIFGRRFNDPDGKEGMTAFIEKRKAVWKNE